MPVAIERTIATSPKEPRGRRWWLHPATFWITALVIIVAARLWWGQVAQARLDAEIAKIHARGEPLDPAEYPRDKLPTEENAADVYLAAARAIPMQKSRGGARNADPAENQPLDLSQELPDRKTLAERSDECAEYLTKAAPVLKGMRDARALNSGDWHLVWRTPLINFLAPHTSTVRSLAKLTVNDALVEFGRGNHQEAIERIRDIVHLGRVMHDTSRTVIESLVAVSIDAVACGAIHQISYELAISGSTPSPGGITPASRESIQALMSELESDAGRGSWRRAMTGERSSLYDTFINNGLGLQGGVVFGIVLGPSMKLETADLLSYVSQMADAGDAPNYPAALQAMPRAISMNTDGIGKYAKLLTSILLPSFDRAFMLHFRSITVRRLATTALAMRLFELDHGRKPKSLEELVPEYLWALPIDPMAADGSTIRYVDHGRFPRIYSVGEDGHDDGGRIAYVKSTTMQSSGGATSRPADRRVVKHYQRDYPFFLCPEPPDTITSPYPTEMLRELTGSADPDDVPVVGSDD